MEAKTGTISQFHSILFQLFNYNCRFLIQLIKTVLIFSIFIILLQLVCKLFHRYSRVVPMEEEGSMGSEEDRRTETSRRIDSLSRRRLTRLEVTSDVMDVTSASVPPPPDEDVDDEDATFDAWGGSGGEFDAWADDDGDAEEEGHSIFR